MEMPSSTASFFAGDLRCYNGQGSHPDRECQKCLRALGIANTRVARPPAGTASLRLYRGLKERYDATQVGRDRRSCTDFTDSPYRALQYASSNA